MYGALEDRALFALFERISLTVIVRVYLALNLFARPTKHGSDPAIQARVAQVTLARYALGTDDESAQRQVQRALRGLQDIGLVQIAKPGKRGSPAIYELAPDRRRPEVLLRNGPAEAPKPCGENVKAPAEKSGAQQKQRIGMERSAHHGQAHDADQFPDRPGSDHDVLPSPSSWAPRWT